MAQIFVKPAWLRLDENPPGAFIQAGIRPYKHQTRTFEWLVDPDIEVIFNCIPTGGGKSLAAFSRTLLAQPPMPALALYPTNELGRDQHSQLKDYVRRFHLSSSPTVCRISANLLAAAADTAGVTKQTELLTRFQESELVLTNPDIYHYLHNLYYLRPHDSRDKMFARLVNNFDLVIFDEFHIFSTPQAVSAMNAILLTRRMSGPGRKKFLFLSATPSHLLRQFLEKAGVPYRVVESESLDLSREDPSSVPAEFYKGWRKITHQVALNFVIIERDAERWIAGNAEAIITGFFRDHPGSKCALILNSVAAAQRVTGLLRERLARHGLTIGQNTGFSTESERSASHKADVLIGTSTIDVGVDFKINLLLFEAVDAGSFIQRLGRLGRHDGYVNDAGIEIQFQSFSAYALVPRFIHERLFLKPDEHSGSPLFIEGGSYSREDLCSAICQVYPRVNDFPHYTERWGVLQSAYVYYSLGQKEIKAAYETVREFFKEDVERAFGITNIGSKVGQVCRYLNDEEGYEREILDVARNFRGTSGLECGVVDLTVADPSERFKTYDLTRLLSNWRVSEVLDREVFLKKAQDAGVFTKPFEEASSYLEVSGFLDRPARWRFHLDCNLGDGDLNISRVLSLNGFRVLGAETEHQNKLNRKLQRRRLVCYILALNRLDVKYQRALPLLFPVYPLADKYSMSDPNPSYSVAFGQGALLLESLFFYCKDPSKGWIV